MQHLSGIRLTLVLATVLFLAWTALNTVCWPVEDYADVTHAYAESTNQIVRGMSIGIAGYLAVIATTVGWGLTNTKPSADQSANLMVEKVG